MRGRGLSARTDRRETLRVDVVRGSVQRADREWQVPGASG